MRDVRMCFVRGPSSLLIKVQSFKAPGKLSVLIAPSLPATFVYLVCLCSVHIIHTTYILNKLRDKIHIWMADFFECARDSRNMKLMSSKKFLMNSAHNFRVIFGRTSNTRQLELHLKVMFVLEIYDRKNVLLMPKHILFSFGNRNKAKCLSKSSNSYLLGQMCVLVVFAYVCQTVDYLLECICVVLIRLLIWHHF